MLCKRSTRGHESERLAPVGPLRCSLSASFTTCWLNTATLPKDRHVEGYSGAQYQDRHDTSYMSVCICKPHFLTRDITAYIGLLSCQTWNSPPLQRQHFKAHRQIQDRS